MKNLILSSLLSVLCCTVWADDLDKGIAAYKAGDFDEAFAQFEPLAKQGVAIAQTNLGSMYNDGTGVVRDHKEAEKWHRLSAEQGFEGGQFNLGVMYSEGKGVEQNHQEAVKWYRLAAEQGNAPAQNGLAIKYAVGNGVAKDLVYAAMWFSLAASNGYAGAQGNLTTTFKNMTPREIALAAELAKECASLNYYCGDLSTSAQKKDQEPFFEWGPIRWDFNDYWLPTIGCNSDYAVLSYIMGCPGA